MILLKNIIRLIFIYHTKLPVFCKRIFLSILKNQDLDIIWQVMDPAVLPAPISVFAENTGASKTKQRGLKVIFPGKRGIWLR